MKFKSIFFGFSAFLMAATTLMAQNPPTAKDVVAEIKAAQGKNAHVTKDYPYEVVKKGTIKLPSNAIKSASVANPNKTEKITEKIAPNSKPYLAEVRGPKPNINTIRAASVPRVLRDPVAECSKGGSINIISPVDGSTQHVNLMNQDVPFDIEFSVSCNSGSGSGCSFCYGYELYLGNSKISSSFYTKTLACDSNGTYSLSGVKTLTPGSYYYKCMIFDNCNGVGAQTPFVTEISHFTVVMP